MYTQTRLLISSHVFDGYLHYITVKLTVVDKLRVHYKCQLGLVKVLAHFHSFNAWYNFASCDAVNANTLARFSYYIYTVGIKTE